MAKVPPPKRSAKGTPPSPVIALANLDRPEPTALTPMNFKVPEEFHREFKLYAVQHGMSMVDLLQQAFQRFKQSARVLK